MDIPERLLDIFLGELEHQCILANKAYNDIIKDMEIRDINGIWYSIQSFLISIGNISKILWPINKKSNKRGQQLRKVLDISNTSPLKSREFRNHFEHFDERIEAWAEGVGQNIYIDKNVSNQENLTNDPSLERVSCLRHFVTDSMVLKFSGDKYELKSVQDAVSELYKSIQDTKEKEYYKRMKNVLKLNK